jgi:6-phospho-beta-glucosidase
MKLTILGGGGFRVPLIHRALLADRAERRISRLTLYDLDASRLNTIGTVLKEQAAGVAGAPQVTASLDLDEAIAGADFIFSAIRVGGLAGRVVDERVALDDGLLGQETVGAGGVSYGLRTLPVAIRLAGRIAAVAPDAWVINFTNPAGMVTEAMSRQLGDRVIGICDSPVGLGRRVAGALGVDPRRAWFDYAGLNHLGWLRAVLVDGRDELPRLLADDTALTSFEEGRLFGAELLRALGAVPNEYLHYYYSTREAVGAARRGGQTRGAFLLTQQRRFYEPAESTMDSPLAAWDATRRERELTYMADDRAAVGADDERAASDVDTEGYEQVALALMRAIALDERSTLILNVRNRGTLDVLDADAVVEVPCHVDANGAHPVAVGALPEHAVGLVCGIKAVERAVLEAATTGARSAALRALAIHPLVDSVAVASRLLDGYQRAIPELAYLKS